MFKHIYFRKPKNSTKIPNLLLMQRSSYQIHSKFHLVIVCRHSGANVNQYQSIYFIPPSDTVSVIHIHNKFTIQKQRQDEKDMLEAI